ncbi:hypothetical protein JX266_003514 [Neoarthrinium moseri]|uniref:uncharacterized protein n=1 Tax=Neoarthrinium moseri TaxID=1658444 RepID=UPI001FDB5409|nr:uncharacterized protein JN550_000577 [Neoarthrinium moseri]KAI1851439.1 hypothetical protein JX266_003514 [Neoarthrinium moseri]KAI1878395.1 hypothetical protein JN550_000577 [Neoarthrinium moseri]
MSSWMNEAAAVQNHNGNNPFPHMNDPNNLGTPAMMDPAAFMANPGQFNPAAAGQFANPQQMAAAMQNGQMRNASPSFQNPVYQTNSVVPSKRPRPREDSIGASPRQNPGMLPTSRADTPQQSQFPGFQQNPMAQQHPGQPQQYPHLQPNGSGNASPSPVMAGNQLRPGSVPQRVNTASPHPFSPASQQFGPQASPVPSEHGGTPQPNPYMQNQNFPQGFNPNYTPSPSPARPPSAQNPMAPQMMPQQMGQMPQQMQQMHPNQMAQMQQMQQLQQMQQAGRGMDPAQQQKMLYQMRLQQQFQQGNMHMAAQMQAAQAQGMGAGRGMMPNKPGMPMPNGQVPPGGMNPQQSQMSRGTNPESFMKNLTSFMTLQNLPLDPNPVIEGRPLHLMQLFMMTSKFGYYRNVTQRNLWVQVASAVGFSPAQIPSAPAQIKAIYEANLLKFEDAWRKQKSGGQQPGSAGGMPGQPAQGTPQRMGLQGQMPQGQQPMHQGQQPQVQQPQVQTPIKQMTPGIQQVNGFSTPQQAQMSQQPMPGQGHMRNSLSRSVDATPVTGEFPMQSPSSAKPGSMSMQLPPAQPDTVQPNGAAAHHVPAEPTDPDEYKVCSRETNPNVFGGHDVTTIPKLGIELEQWRPDIPPPLELGMIDIHALIKSLQCGIHGEIRLALDTLGTVTFESIRNPSLTIDLRGCDDLVESLIDCAEEQVDILAEGTKPNSDEIDLSSYEDVLRQCRYEHQVFKKVAAFGDEDYELDHAADRLIAITTILRNLSFHDPNHDLLADEVIVKFLCSTIRSLGTLESLLRSPTNTLDFMKDVIIILSNIAGSIELPGKEQAYCLLQFLLSFAPSPSPITSSGKVLFAPFEPAVHIYLPHAVDALAKLFARDEPNRTHYKAIFATDASATPGSELLTRTFGLAICPLPDQNKESRPANLPSFIEARKPMIMQGLLAADVLASLAPSYESGVARAWLSSSDGFAQNLYKLVRSLCNQAEPTPPPGRGGNTRTQPREDTDLLHIITWGVSLLRKLCEKARDPNDPSSIPPQALPTKESLFLAFQSLKSPKWTVLLNQLSLYAGMED